MNAYEQKQEARRDRLSMAADRAERASLDAYKRSDMREGASGIPLGQPILVGHHSEGRHRAALKRADNAMRSSVENGKKAAQLRSAADGVGSGGISSDDPAAVRKLQDQIDAAQGVQDFMREANKVIRKAVKAGMVDELSEGFDGFRSEISAVKGSDVRVDQAAALLKPDFANRIGFAGYQLSNNSANIKRMEKRVAVLRAAHAEAEAAGGENVSKIYEGLCAVVDNFDENRLQILFAGKPRDDVRAELKSNGFRWAPSQNAWQRQLNNGAREAAKRFLRSQGVEA